MNDAVLQRELRRLVRSRACWAMAIGLGLMMAGTGERAEITGGWVGAGAACMALFWAHRSMQAELEEETIEHLGTLPVSPLSVVFQIGLGAALAATIYSLLALMIAQPRPLCGALSTWVRGVALAFSFGVMGAMGAFRYGESFFGSVGAMAPMAVLTCLAFSAQAAIFVRLDVGPAVLATLALGIVMALACYWFWLALGGQWVESILPRPDRKARRPRGPDDQPESFTPAPDWLSPVFWYELNANSFWLAIYVGLPSAAILLFGFLRWVGPDLQEVIGGFSMSLGTLIVTLATSARAAQHRRTGLWTDLAVTPQATWKIVLAQVAGVLARSCLIVLSWMFCAWVAAGGELPRGGTYWFILVLPAIWAIAALCGYLAGAWTTGWKAGLLGVFLMYMSVCVYPMLQWMLWSMFGIAHWRHGSEGLFLPVMGAWTLLLFYGCVKRVAAFQA